MKALVVGMVASAIAHAAPAVTVEKADGVTLEAATAALPPLACGEPDLSAPITITVVRGKVTTVLVPPTTGREFARCAQRALRKLKLAGDAKLTVRVVRSDDSSRGAIDELARMPKIDWYKREQTVGTGVYVGGNWNGRPGTSHQGSYVPPAPPVMHVEPELELPPASVRVVTPMTRDEVTAVMVEHAEGFRHCYEQALGFAMIRGRFVYAFTIANGRAVAVRAASPSEASRRLDACMVAEIRTLAFPERGLIDIRYPFDLSP